MHSSNNSIRSVSIREIDIADETFSINFMPDLERLRASIEGVGIVQPVLLASNDGRYRIVCGFRRIWVLEQLRIEEVRASVLEDNSKDQLQLFLIALHDNLASRGLNTVEKAIALDKLINQFCLSRSMVIQRIMPLLGLETNEKILNTYLSLARMEIEVKRYVLEKGVSRSNIRRLDAMSSRDRLALVSILSGLRLGENSTREVLTLIEEISSRDRISPGQVLDRPEIRCVLSQQSLTPSQKTERLKKILFEMRYPRFCELERKFLERRSKLVLPPGVSIHHDPNFEEKGLRLDFGFKNIEQYRSILSFLSGLVDRKEFREMLEE